MQSGLMGLAMAAVACDTARAEPALGIAGTLPPSGDYGEVLTALEDVSADSIHLTLF